MKNVERSGFLYSVWSGHLLVYEGVIEQYDFDDKVGAFISPAKRMQCSVSPEVVHNSVVWLSERNDEIAKQILIKYEREQIVKLQFKIDNHLNKIKSIEES